MDLAKREVYGKALLACGICAKLIKKVTIIEECCHRFCKKCITKKLTEEKLNHCPVCNANLNDNPLQNLRQDNHWNEIRDVIRNKRREELLQPNIAQTSRGRTLSSLADAAVALAATEAATAAASPKRKNVRRGGRRKASAHPESVIAVDGKKQGELLASNNQMPKDPFEGMSELRETLIPPEDDNNNRNGMDNVVSKQGVDEPPSTANNQLINAGIWFCLVPSDKQSCESRLPEMPGRYILVRDVHKPVSSIRKYIAQKLNLHGQHEVEISVLGKAVVGDEMTWLQLLGLWCKAMPKVETQVCVGSSAKDFLMTLNYALMQH